MTSFKVNDVELNFEEEGTGAPMLLLGGTLSLGREEFAPQIEEFGKTFRIMLPDRRGYGRSRPPDRDFPLDFYRRDAVDLAALLQEIDAGPTNVLGWSEGADVALCLAERSPKLVRKLVVWGGIAAVRESDLVIFDSMRDISTWPRKVRDRMDTAYGAEYWHGTWSKWCDVMRDLHAGGGDAHLGSIENIACPTLIIHGEADPLISRFHPMTLNRRIRHSRFEEIVGASHNVHLGKPVQFNSLVADFLAG